MLKVKADVSSCQGPGGCAHAAGWMLFVTCSAYVVLPCMLQDIANGFPHCIYKELAYAAAMNSQARPKLFVGSPNMALSVFLPRDMQCHLLAQRMASPQHLPCQASPAAHNISNFSAAKD